LRQKESPYIPSEPIQPFPQWSPPVQASRPVKRFGWLALLISASVALILGIGIGFLIGLAGTPFG
jgi:hypothetical protein